MYKKRVLALFIILQIVVTSMFPVRAHAATYGPEVRDLAGVENFKVVAGVSNRYDAALGLIGRWGSKIQITNTEFVKLSNEGSGGAFWELAQMLDTAPGAWETAPAPLLGNVLAMAAWTALNTEVQFTWGDPTTWLWWGVVSDADISQAREDFDKVMRGESLGGGGSSDDGDYYTLQCQSRTLYTNQTSAPNGVMNLKSGDDWYYSRVNQQGKPIDAYGENKANYHLLSDNFILQVPKAWFGNIQSNADFDAQNIWATARGGGNGTSIELILNVGSTPVTFGSYQAVTIEDSTFVGGYYRSYDCGSFCYASNGRSYTTVNYTFDGQVLTVSRNNNNSLSFTKYSSATGTTDACKFAYLGSGGGGGGDNHWPEPEPPDPKGPTSPDPDPPTPPTINLPDLDFPDISVDSQGITVSFPQNTTSADYTPWLRAILTALNTIIEDLGEHCDHIRVAIRDYTNILGQSIADNLEYYYNDLTAYLGDLAEWMIEHMNFDLGSPGGDVNVDFDDTNIISWLRRIYDKMRGTRFTPPDPVEDTEGAFDWWTELLQWIANALGGLLTDFVGDIGGYLEELATKFPFSVPWDILAYLTLLDAQRQTPVVTFTMPASRDGWWDTYDIEIDLQPYDSAMAVVRAMVLVWWGFILAMKTDWMMLLFDWVGDFAGNVVSRLTGKAGTNA